jgi:hypothetical protein
MLYIMTAPRVYKKLRDEIDAAIAENKVSQPITVDEAKSLPYLQVSPPVVSRICFSSTGGLLNVNFRPLLRRVYASIHLSLAWP